MERSLRQSAVLALGGGALGSVGFLLRAGGNRQVLLLVLFTGWVLAPFVVLGLALLRAGTWPAPAQRALYAMTCVIALGSLAIYGTGWRPFDIKPAAPYLLVPLGSLAIVLIVIPMALRAARAPRP